MQFEIFAERNGLVQRIEKRSAVIAVATARVLLKDGFEVTVADDEGIIRGPDRFNELLAFKPSPRVRLPDTTAPGDILSLPRALPKRRLTMPDSLAYLIHSILPALSRHGPRRAPGND